LQSGRQRQRAKKSERANDYQQRAVNPEPRIHLAEISLQVNRAKTRAPLSNLLKHNEVIAVESVSVGFRL